MFCIRAYFPISLLLSLLVSLSAQAVVIDHIEASEDFPAINVLQEQTGLPLLQLPAAVTPLMSYDDLVAAAEEFPEDLNCSVVGKAFTSFEQLTSQLFKQTQDFLTQWKGVSDSWAGYYASLEGGRHFVQSGALDTWLQSGDGISESLITIYDVVDVISERHEYLADQLITCFDGQQIAEPLVWGKPFRFVFNGYLDSLRNFFESLASTLDIYATDIKRWQEHLAQAEGETSDLSRGNLFCSWNLGERSG